MTVDPPPEPVPQARLAPEILTLRGDALLLWSDAAARRSAIEAIVRALHTGDAELAQAVARVDAAVVAGLRALGLPRGPVRRIVIEGGMGPYGRKSPDCTIVLGGDRFRELVPLPQGPDSVFRTWVHESIHARQPYVAGCEREYVPRRGYEEGMAEGLTRMIVRNKAGMDPIEVSYQYYVAAYRTLATVFRLDVERLWRRLWAVPLGRARGVLVQSVDELRQDGTGSPWTESQRVRLVGWQTSYSTSLGGAGRRTRML